MSDITNQENKMILNRLKILIAEKELKEGKKLPYRVIAEQTGVSTSTITAYTQQKVFRFDAQTIEAFCKYFKCQPGELLIWDENNPWVIANMADMVDPDPKKDKEYLAWLKSRDNQSG